MPEQQVQANACKKSSECLNVLTDSVTDLHPFVMHGTILLFELVLDLSKYPAEHSKASGVFLPS